MKSFFGVSSLLALAAAEVCHLPLDVVFLQDTTGSFEKNLPIVARQIPDMLASIMEQNPDSYFAVAEFKDKPYFPLGESEEYCYKLAGALSSEVSTFQSSYDTLYTSGGGDLPEAQFQAILDVAQDPAVGWRPLARGGTLPSATHAGARLIIVSTDARPHIVGDAHIFHAQYPDTVPLLSANHGAFNGTWNCLHTDYPSADQLKATLQRNDIHLVILTPVDSARDPGVQATWTWVNQALLHQPPAFYQIIAEDSSDIIQGVLQALQAVTQTVCATTTTTPNPNDTTTLTTTTTTTTTTPATTTTTTTPATTTTTPATTTTTPATTTTTPTTTMATTASSTATSTTSTTDAAVTAAGATESSSSVSEDDSTECVKAAVVVKVVDRPKKLRIEYDA